MTDRGASYQESNDTGMATTRERKRAVNDAERRKELADFLRTRRARLKPSDVGLPPGVRRKTTGLRREEVAQLACVGVTGTPDWNRGVIFMSPARSLKALRRSSC
jgi:hypothetical protein